MKIDDIPIVPAGKPVWMGVDIVHIPTFKIHYNQPGTTFHQVFSTRERHDAHASHHTYASLAARWAAKEAVIKAWSQSLYGHKPPLREEDIDWTDIEVIRDKWHRPTIRLHRHLEAACCASLKAKPYWLLSLSHDGDYAIAYVHMVVSHREDPRGDTSSQ